MPGRVPQIHFSLFSPRNGRKTSKGVRLVWTGFCMEPARGSWLPWKHMHFSICRKRSSFDWLCTPVLCPTTEFGVTADCSKHPEKPSLSVVGCSGGDGFCDLAGRLIGFLRKAFKVLDHKGRTAAYKGFVRPMLEYCPLVWSGAADGHLRRLDKVQKRALWLLGQGTIVDSLVQRSAALSVASASERPPPAHTPCSASPTSKTPGRGDNPPYASLAAMFKTAVRHFDCVINRGC